TRFSRDWSSDVCSSDLTFVVGNGLDDGVTIGPLINTAAVEKVLGHIEDARSHGAVATIGGRAHAKGRTFVEPTVLTGVTGEMRRSEERRVGKERRSRWA